MKNEIFLLYNLCVYSENIASVTTSWKCFGRSSLGANFNEHLARHAKQSYNFGITHDRHAQQSTRFP